jgi:hypothetical protein
MAGLLAAYGYNLTGELYENWDFHSCPYSLQSLLGIMPHWGCKNYQHFSETYCLLQGIHCYLPLTRKTASLWIHHGSLSAVHWKSQDRNTKIIK